MQLNTEENYTFIQWSMTKKMWDSLSWFDKLRAYLLFKVILPCSKLVVEDSDEKTQ